MMSSCARPTPGISSPSRPEAGAAYDGCAGGASTTTTSTVSSRPDAYRRPETTSRGSNSPTRSTSHTSPKPTAGDSSSGGTPHPARTSTILPQRGLGPGQLRLPVNPVRRLVRPALAALPHRDHRPGGRRHELRHAHALTARLITDDRLQPLRHTHTQLAHCHTTNRTTNRMQAG